MLHRPRNHSLTRKALAVFGICVSGLILFGVRAVLLSAAQSQDMPPVPSMIEEPVAEEMDIFRERSRRQAREERREQKQKQKKKPPPTLRNSFKIASDAPVDVGDGFGNLGRVSHLALKTFGRNESITPLETMPYILTDEHFFFADVRGFVTNRSLAGGNAGLGYRHLREDYNAWGGASVWYDGDDSSSKYFQQVGLSFEGLIQRFEFRSNVYLPISTRSQSISNSVNGGTIVGNQLIYGRDIVQGYSLQGVDFEAGYSLPVFDIHTLRGFVGGYHFDGSSVGGVNGFKARAEFVYNNGPSAQVLYTSDKLYGDNLMVGVSMQFPFGNNHPSRGWRRNTPSPFRFVERNYNVIVDQQRTNLGHQVANDPTTGNPYVVDQVYARDIPPGAGALVAEDGTTSRPYSSVAKAQAAGANLILVQGGSVIDSPVTLTAGQRLLALGSYAESLPIAGGGTVQIPNLLQAVQQGNSSQTLPGNPAQTPIFSNVTGTALTIASNTEVAGFVFSGATGEGISGTNVTNTSLHDLKFIATTGDSIHLTNSSGNVTLFNDQINGSTASGIVLDGGNANITFNGAGNTISTQGDGFVLSNLTGGTVAINNLNVKGTGGVGLKLASVGTNVDVTTLSASQTTGPAVAISGNTGQIQTVNGVSKNVYNTYNFNGYTNITSPKGAGFTLSGSDAIVNVANLNVVSTAGSPAVSLVNNSASAVTFSNLTLNTNGGTGLYAVGLADLVVTGGTITSINGPAINIQNSAINTTFTSVSANGGSLGIGLAQSSGLFKISGAGSAGSGGTIQNATTGVKINSFGSANLNWMNFASNGVALQSTASSQLTLNNLNIAGSTGFAIISNDDSTFALTGSTLTGNGTVGGGTIQVQADAVGTFRSLISGNTITDANGTAIQYLTLPNGTGASLGATVQSNTISGSHGASPIIGVNWNGPVSFATTNNTIYAYGSAMTGLLVQDTSTTQSMSLSATGNTMTFEPGASQGTGVSIISASTSQAQVSGNTVNFLATGGIGTRFSLAGTSTDYIASNIITDQAGGATGMLFDSVASNSRLQIDGNTITLLSTDLTTHQGIIFSQVTPTIQFSGTVNNLIYNAPTLQSLFSIPVNAATGGFYINGSLVQ